MSRSTGIEVRPLPARCNKSSRPLPACRRCRRLSWRKRPELRGEPARRRLEQRRQVDVIGAEAHAVFAQARARRLVQPLHFLGDALAIEHAERLDQLKGDAARNAGHVGGGRQVRTNGPSSFSMWDLTKAIEPRFDGIARRAGELLVGDDAHARAQHLFAGVKLADRGAGPAQRAVGGEHELIVRRLGKPRRARRDLAGERLLRGVLQRLRFRAARRRIRHEDESVEPADDMAFDHDLAGLVEFGIERSRSRAAAASRRWCGDRRSVR